MSKKKKGAGIGGFVAGLAKAAALVGVGFAASQALQRRRLATPDPRRALPPAPDRALPPVSSSRSAPQTGSSDGLRGEKPSERTARQWIPGPDGSLHLLTTAAVAEGPSPTAVDGSLPILLLHGLAGRAEHWLPVMEGMPDSVAAAALDLPGHGPSDAPSEDEEPWLDTLVAAVGATVAGLGWRRFLLVGHDFGATVAVAYAGRNPGRVAGLLLVDPNGDQSRIPEVDRQSFLRDLAQAPHDELGLSYRDALVDAAPETRDRVLQDLADTPAAVIEQSMDAAFAYSPLADLDAYAASPDAEIRCILSPTNDLPFSLHRLRPRLKVAILRRAGHWIPLDTPDELRALIGDLVAELGLPGSSSTVN